MRHSVLREKQSSALSCVSCADPFSYLQCLVSDAELRHSLLGPSVEGPSVEGQIAL